MNKTITKPRVLVIDDEDVWYHTVQQLLPRDQFDVVWAERREQALERMSRRPADLIILDLRLSERSDDASGLDLLKELRKMWPLVQVIVFTSVFIKEPDVVQACLKDGAYYYFLKQKFSTDRDSFLTLVREALVYKPQHDIIEDTYPHPLALLYRDYRRNVVAPHLKFRRLIELPELLVKFSAILCLSALKNDIAVVAQSRAALTKPSLGNWFEFLQKVFGSHLRGVWVDNLRQIFTGPRRQNIAELVQVRNEWIGHGATRSDHKYMQMVNQWNSAVLELLNAASVLSAWQLFMVKSTRLLASERYLHTVVNLKGHNPRFLSEELPLGVNCEADRVYVLDRADEKLLCLHPFLSAFLCDQCNQEAVFVYDKIDRDRVLYLDYVNGHHSASVETYRAVKDILSGGT